jgi:PilZ domain-containing protein
MAHEIKTHQRRYVRAPGPVDGYHLGLPKTPVLIYDLNVGGGFVNFSDEQPADATLTLCIELPYDGRITVNAETVYRHPSGIAVRFVDLDAETTRRLGRTVNALVERQRSS